MVQLATRLCVRTTEELRAWRHPPRIWEASSLVSDVHSAMLLCVMRISALAPDEMPTPCTSAVPTVCPAQSRMVLAFRCTTAATSAKMPTPYTCASRPCVFAPPWLTRLCVSSRLAPGAANSSWEKWEILGSMP